MKRDRYVLLLIPLLLALAAAGWWIFARTQAESGPVTAIAQDASGETVAANIPPLQANAPVVPPETVLPPADATEPAPTDTHAPDELQPPELLLQPDRDGVPGEFILRVRLSGHVSDYLGADAAYVAVSVSCYAVANPGDVPEGLHVEPATESFGATQIATTAADGTFDVEVGLRLRFKDVSFASLHLRAFDDVSYSEVVVTEWTNKAQPPAVELTIPGNGGFEGRLVDEYGVPIQGVSVFLSLLPQLGVGTPVMQLPVASDANGWFRIVNVAANRMFSVRVANSDWSIVAGAAALSVKPGEIAILAEDIVLRQRTRLKLEMRADGLALAELNFTIQYTAGVEPLGDAIVSTDANGCLYLYDPPESALTLSVQTSGFEGLEISLPAMFQPGINDLGSYGLTRLR